MQLPLVSVVLAVRNEEASIRRVLAQIFSQDYPASLLEVIVVDGQSDDKTAEVAGSFSHCGRAPIVIRFTERGRSQGLNAGIRAAKGSVIVRIDARTSIEPDYMSRCVDTLLTTGADNVGGVQRPIARSKKQKAIGIALSHPFGVGNAPFRLGNRSGFVESVYLGCFRREVFDKVGFFDEDAPVISEESDLNLRIRKTGGSVYLNKDIVASYYPRERFIDFWKLYYRYGGARAGTFLKHKTLTSWRQLVPPLFLLVLASCALIGAIVDLRLLYLVPGILGIYAIINTFVSISLVLKTREFNLVPLLFSAFACMHFAWGLGFWRRLIVPERAKTYWGN